MSTYWQAKGRQGSETSRPPPATLALPPLDPALVRLATESLPENSPLFQRALNHPELVDDSDVSHWDTGPPYATLNTTSTASPSEMDWTAKLVEIWHGRRLRLQREDAGKRREDFVRNRSAAMRTMKEEAERLTEDWFDTRAFLVHHHEGARETWMAEVFHQWQAREIYHLYYLEFLVNV